MVFALLCVLSWLAVGQSALLQTSDEVITRPQVTAFRTRVSEVEVPVVVRDGRGRTVAGLRKEDFRLSDNGKAQVISRFTVKDPGHDALPESPRFIAYVLNDVLVPPNRLGPVRDAAIRHMAAALGPKDRAAILCTSGRIATEFTDDPKALAKALSGIRQPALTRYQVPMPSTSGADLVSSPRFYVDSVGQMFREFGRESLDALQLAIRRLSAMRGQRTIVWASAGFPTGDLTISAGSGAYTLHVAPREYVDEIIQQAIQSQVVINCLDAGGLSTASFPTFTQEAESVLADLSNGTGGVLFRHDNNLDEGFRQASAPPQNSYILAFSPRELKHDGSFHRLKVAVKSPEHLEIQARAGYFAPSDRQVQQPSAGEIDNLLHSREQLTGIPADFRTSLTRLNGAIRLNVEIHLGLRALHFRKSDGRHLTELTLAATLFDGNGVPLQSNETAVDLRLKDGALAQWMRNGVGLGAGFDVNPGVYRVRVVIREREKGAVTAHTVPVEVR